MQSSYVNNEIRSFNRKLMKSARAYQHASILEMSSNRKLFTNHDLHQNGLGKEVLSKQIFSHIYALLDQKKDPSDNLKLEIRSNLHRYTTSGKSYKQNIHQNKEDPINEIWWIFMVSADLNVEGDTNINPLNAELNPICHLLALLGAHHILHVSGIRVKGHSNPLNAKLNPIFICWHY